MILKLTYGYIFHDGVTSELFFTNMQVKRCLRTEFVLQEGFGERVHNLSIPLESCLAMAYLCAADSRCSLRLCTVRCRFLAGDESFDLCRASFALM